MVASALDWWVGAGIDGFAQEEARDWLAPPPRRPSMEDAAPASPASRDAALPAPVQPARPAALPDSLDGLLTLLATGDYAPDPAPPHRRVAPSGQAGAGLMVVADMPDPGDAEAGKLFVGEIGGLYDAMLAAMGLDRAAVYCAPLSPARLAGRVGEEHGAALARLMRRHVALARPRGLMLLGDAAARLLIGPDALERRGGLRSVNHDGGTMPAIAISHPRLLYRHPAGKAAAWADMRLMIGVLSS